MIKHERENKIIDEMNMPKPYHYAAKMLLCDSYSAGEALLVIFLTSLIAMPLIVWLVIKFGT